MIVDHALEERRTPGNTLIVQPDKPYQVPDLIADPLCRLIAFGVGVQAGKMLIVQPDKPYQVPACSLLLETGFEM